MLKLKLKQTLLILLLFCSLLFLIPNVYSSSDYVSGSDFGLTIPNGFGLGFQNDVNIYVAFQVTSGIVNGTNTSVRIHEAGGYFKFTAYNTTIIRVTFENMNIVKVGGDSGNQMRGITSGASFNINPNDDITISWDTTFIPVLPILFVFGIIGFIAVFGGPAYFVSKVKHGEYYEGSVNGFLITIIGIIFIIIWLWG